MVNHNIEAAALVSRAVVVLLDKYGKIVADAVKVAAFPFPPLFATMDTQDQMARHAPHAQLENTRITAMGLPAQPAQLENMQTEWEVVRAQIVQQENTHSSQALPAAQTVNPAHTNL